MPLHQYTHNTVIKDTKISLFPSPLHQDQCVDSEAAMQAQNEEMMALVMEQYNNMSVSMEEEKKAKLEQLYDQIVSFQESIDAAKGTLETTAREAETEARVSPPEAYSSLIRQ